MEALPASIGALAHLRVFFHIPTQLPGDVEHIVFPESIGNWTKLRTFIYCLEELPLETQGVTFARSMVNWANLMYFETLAITTNETFPMDVLSIPELQVVRVKNMLLPSMPHVGSMPNLRVLALKGTGLKGALPSFKALTLISNVDLSNNQLTNSTSDCFDDCSSLFDLNLKGNDIYSPLYTFKSCSKLSQVDLTSNKVSHSYIGTLYCPDYLTNSGLKIDFWRNSCPLGRTDSRQEPETQQQ